MSSAFKCRPVFLLAGRSMIPPPALPDSIRSFVPPSAEHETNSTETTAQAIRAVDTRFGIGANRASGYLPSDLVTAVIALVALLQPA